MLNPMLNKQPVETEITMENIAKDKGGVLLRSMLDELNTVSAQVQRKLNTGLNQEDFKRHNTFKRGIDRAIVVLEKVWSKLQR